MIHVPTHPLAHYGFDVLAWIAAGLAARWQYRRWPEQVVRLSQTVGPGYFVALGIGAVVGAWIAGSANTMRGGLFAPSHSIAGALAGGIVAVELWKWMHGVRGSTGGALVLPIAVGIVVGRFGCLFAGLADYTYGIPSRVPWSVELGDGIARHPVQIYESAAMAAFIVIYIRARNRRADWAEHHAFHAMIIYYAAQRFAWEFLKPYPAVLGPLNTFQLLMLGLIAYGFFWWNGHRAAEPGAA